MFTLLTLANGLEIFGKHMDSTDNAIQIHMPMMVISKKDDEGSPYFQMMPFSAYTRISSFNKRYIVAVANDAIPSLANVWHQIVEIDNQQQLESQMEQEAEEDVDGTPSEGNEEHGLNDNVLPFTRPSKPTLH